MPELSGHLSFRLLRNAVLFQQTHDFLRQANATSTSLGLRFIVVRVCLDTLFAVAGLSSARLGATVRVLRTKASSEDRPALAGLMDMLARTGVRPQAYV
jgi:hypothetical protein